MFNHFCDSHLPPPSSLTKAWATFDCRYQQSPNIYPYSLHTHTAFTSSYSSFPTFSTTIPNFPSHPRSGTLLPPSSKFHQRQIDDSTAH
mmetsp:Transcript_21713/g.47186  ORF Transcript_21713/g.47186 Transcript_21713/m.47186 type:complete len:89 (-) Transcript_21713:681-947(-)